MDRVFESGAVVLPPAAPGTPSTGHPTGGNPIGGVEATKPGAWWFHMVTEELRNVIEDAGLTPDHLDLAQLSQGVSQLAMKVAQGIRPIAAAVAANALTITLNPTSLQFRNSTLGDGSVNTRSVGAPITLTVSAGSTLGTVNGVLSKLAVLALDNAGTVELAVVNLAGGVNLDERGLISTSAEGGAGAADSSSTVYSATARSNVSFRLLGFIESTQAAAGTWATPPSLVDGGVASMARWLQGYGQSWQSVTRNAATTYTNTTGRSISLEYYASSAAGTNELTVAGTVLAQIAFNSSGSTFSAEIPHGVSYSYTGVAMSARELR